MAEDGGGIKEEEKKIENRLADSAAEIEIFLLKWTEEGY